MNKRAKKKRLSKNIEHILAGIGYILYVSSLIEYNLVQIISAEIFLQVFDKEDISFFEIIEAKKDSNNILHELSNNKIMMGKLVDILKKTNSFDEHFINNLYKASEIRGYYAHKFFKEDLYPRYMERNPLVYKKKINNDLSFLCDINDYLFSLDQQNRELVNKARLLGI